MQKQRYHKREAMRLLQGIRRALRPSWVTQETPGSFVYKTWVTPGHIFKLLHEKQAYSSVSPRRRTGVKEGYCTPRMTSRKKRCHS